MHSFFYANQISVRDVSVLLVGSYTATEDGAFFFLFLYIATIYLVPSRNYISTARVLWMLLYNSIECNIWGFCFYLFDCGVSGGGGGSLEMCGALFVNLFGCTSNFMWLLFCLPFRPLSLFGTTTKCHYTVKMYIWRWKKKKKTKRKKQTKCLALFYFVVLSCQALFCHYFLLNQIHNFVWYLVYANNNNNNHSNWQVHRHTHIPNRLNDVVMQL